MHLTVYYEQRCLSPFDRTTVEVKVWFCSLTVSRNSLWRFLCTVHYFCDFSGNCCHILSLSLSLSLNICDHWIVARLLIHCVDFCSLFYRQSQTLLPESWMECAEHMRSTSQLGVVVTIWVWHLVFLGPVPHLVEDMWITYCYNSFCYGSWNLNQLACQIHF